MSVGEDRNRRLPFDARTVDTLILSHAHIDHSGNIPNLVKSGFKGDIIATSATRDLCSIMLRDSAKIQESDVAYLNKKRRRDNQPPLEPIYTTADALASLKQFIGISYERPYLVAPGVTLTFYDAGHVLGSALVVLDVADAAQDKLKLLCTANQEWCQVMAADFQRKTGLQQGGNVFFDGFVEQIHAILRSNLVSPKAGVSKTAANLGKFWGMGRDCRGQTHSIKVARVNVEPYGGLGQACRRFQLPNCPWRLVGPRF